MGGKKIVFVGFVVFVVLVTGTTLVHAGPADRAQHYQAQLKSKDVPTRLRAAQGLARLGSVGVPGMILALEDPRWQIREAAAKGLRKVGARHLPALAGALRHKHPRVRLHVAQVIGKLGARAHRLAPIMHLAINDREWGVRLAIARTLALWHLASSTPTLLRCLKDRYHLVRAAVIPGLAAAPSHQVAITKALLKSVSDSHEAVRYAAIRALLVQHNKRKDPAHAARLAALFVTSLHDTTWRVRWAATHSIGRLGPPAKAAIPALKRAYYDKRRKIRGSAAIALGHIGRPALSMLPVFIQLLKRDDAMPMIVNNLFSPLGRYSVAMKLRKRIPYLKHLFAVTRGIAAYNKLAVPQLVGTLKRLKSPHPWFVFTLGCIGPNAKAALPTLMAWHNHSKVPYAWVLLLALSRIAPQDPRVKRILWKARKHSSHLIRIAAAKALIQTRDPVFRKSKAYATHKPNKSRIHQAASNLLIVMRTRSLTPTLFFK